MTLLLMRLFTIGLAVYTTATLDTTLALSRENTNTPLRGVVLLPLMHCSDVLLTVLYRIDEFHTTKLHNSIVCVTRSQ